MEKYDYSSLEQFYIYPQHIEKYYFVKHLHDIEAIVSKNLEDFSTLKTKKFYYFKMPVCGHPNFISLTELRKRLESKNQELLCCRICKWLIDSSICYDQLAELYSTNNQKPLGNVNFRKDEVIFTCPDCNDDTPYKEMRWVLNHLRSGESFKGFCKGRCYSVGINHPYLVHLWDEKRNNCSVFSVTADDYNLYHRKAYFSCVVCEEKINTPMTIYNALLNSPRCIRHKVKPGTSFAEMAVFFSFFRCLSKFTNIEINHKYKYHQNREFDIYINIQVNDENHFFAIEVDGIHHKDTIDEDENKNRFAIKNGINLLRLRDLSLKGITLKCINNNNIVQRTSKDKKELNTVIPELLEKFLEWASNLNVENKTFEELKETVRLEKNTLNVIRDEKSIFQTFDHVSKKLLKDAPKLRPIFEQLREDVRNNLGNFITTTEQDIKRPFVCSKCDTEWEQYVHVVVRNFQNSNSDATGCPTCANKNKENNNKLRSHALYLKGLGLTQLEIGKQLGRSQSTISSWLSNVNEEI